MTKTDRDNWMTYDSKDLVSKCMTITDMKMNYQFNPVYQAVFRNTYAYYSTILDAQSWMTALNYVGEQGELVKMSIPQARTQTRQLVTLLTKQKLAFNAIAMVNKSDVAENVRIANALAAQEVKEQKLDIKQELLAERGLVQGTSFIKSTWRSDFGKPRAVEDLGDGKKGVIYEGGNEISCPSFFDMTYDYTIENWDELPYVICRVKRNRWDLIAQHPALEEKLMNAPSVQESAYNPAAWTFDTRDMIYVWELFGRARPGLPRGRMTAFVDSDCVLVDDVNEYENIPIQQLKAEPVEGLGFGYPMLSNLLPAQEMMDHNYSALATNASSLGVINIANPKGSDIDVRQINGMNFIDYKPQNIPGGGMPTKMDLLQSAPELFKLPESLLSSMRDMSFINDAVSGKLPASTSGVAIATLTTNALEFLSSYSKNLQVVLQNTLYQSIVNYRKFAKVERLVEITGQNFQAFSKPFTGDMLAPIKSIEMQSVNPFMQSIAGRLEIADKAAERGYLKNLQGYISILEGAPINSVYKTELSQNDLIQSENERLNQGQPVKAISTDKHPLHIYEHNALLNDPQIRLNSPLVANIQAHILEHLELQKITDPMLMAMANTGQIPEGMPMAPPPPMVDPGMAPGPDGAMGEEMELGGDVGQQMAPDVAEPAEPAEDLLGRTA